MLRQMRKDGGEGEVLPKENGGAGYGHAEPDDQSLTAKLLSKPIEAAHRMRTQMEPTNETAAEIVYRQETGEDGGEDGVSSTVRTVINSTMRTISKATKGKSDSNFFQNVEKPMEDMMKTVSKKTSIPFWAVFMIFMVIVGIFALVFFCCLQKWWRRFRGKEAKGGFMGGKVDLKSVQLLGQSYKEKVQPDMDDLTKDMEQNETGKDDAKEEIKLGRLQFKIDYDFNQSQVRSPSSSHKTQFKFIWFQLAVGVLQAEELPGMDMSGTSDPYVKVRKSGSEI